VIQQAWRGKELQQQAGRTGNTGEGESG
jgi:hypothetical protein